MSQGRDNDGPAKPAPCPRCKAVAEVERDWTNAVVYVCRRCDRRWIRCRFCGCDLRVAEIPRFCSECGTLLRCE